MNKTNFYVLHSVLLGLSLLGIIIVTCGVLSVEGNIGSDVYILLSVFDSFNLIVAIYNICRLIKGPNRWYC